MLLRSEVVYDENGTVTTQFFSADNHLQKETSVYSNNDTEVTDFDLNGQPVKNVSVTSTASGQMRSELLYKDGKESSEYITYGNTVEEYSYINDEPVLQRKVQNKGLEWVKSFTMENVCKNYLKIMQ